MQIEVFCEQHQCKIWQCICKWVKALFLEDGKCHKMRFCICSYLDIDKLTHPGSPSEWSDYSGNDHHWQSMQKWHIDRWAYLNIWVFLWVRIQLVFWCCLFTGCLTIGLSLIVNLPVMFVQCSGSILVNLLSVQVYLRAASWHSHQESPSLFLGCSGENVVACT